MKPKSFPEKTYLEDVITALHLTEISVAGALKHILLHSKSGSLPIYFDDGVTGSVVTSSFEEITDDQGNITNILVAESEFVDIGSKSVTEARVSKDSLNTFLSVSRFITAGKEYYAVDETGMWLESAVIHYNRFYCRGQDLSDFLKEGKSKKQAKSHKPIQKEREDAFKQWLSTKAGKRVIKDSQYQEIYITLGSPTRNQLWKELGESNPRLFSKGKDDFFKKQQIIRLKDGTGTGRQCD